MASCPRRYATPLRSAPQIKPLLSYRLLTGILFHVQPRDPRTFATVVLILGRVALAATILPARRATSVEPLETLRAE